MDRRSTTGTPGVYTGERQASVSGFLTSIVLLAGVLGGLVIVVTVILVCKFCQGHRKPSSRQVLLSSRGDYPSDRQSRYDTINSDVLSEQSSGSIQRSSLTPRSIQHFRFPDRNGDPETAHLNCDSDTDDYSDSNQARVQTGAQAEHIDTQGSTQSPRIGQHGGQDGSRYSDGDYHHLKHSKIGRSLPRQFSMGGAGSTVQGRALIDHPQCRFSSLDERLSTSVTYQSEQGAEGQTYQSEQGAQGQTYQQQSLHQQQQPVQQQQHGDIGRTAAEKSSLGRYSRDIQHSEDHFRQSRDKRDPPSSGCRGTLGPINFPTTQSSMRDDIWPLPFSIRPNPDLPPSPLHFRRGEDPNTSPPSPFRPIKDIGRSAFSPHRPIWTQVSVEVHQYANNRDSSTNSSEELHQRLLCRLDRVRNQEEFWPTQNIQQHKRRSVSRPGNSHSLETPRPSYYKDTRQVYSYDDFREDYDVLKITEFLTGPFYNTDYDVISELRSPTSSKVRYNDTGSLEQLSEDANGFSCAIGFNETASAESRRDLDFSEDSETLNGSRKNRALWRLRTTLEEEEECSDTIRMEDLTSPDESPDREHVTPNTTSFESSVQSEPCPSDHRDSGIQFEIYSAKPLNHVNFLHPNYENRRQNFENRRQNYRNVMSDRLKRGHHQSTSVENSFDSMETDGDISDTSRYEMTTTSFESSTTTDNTDSTNESQASKLRQMKADSGYKSLETQQQSSRELGDHEHAKWDIRASVECGEGIASRRDRRTSVERGEAICQTCGHQGATGLDISDLSSQHPTRLSQVTSAHSKNVPLCKQWPAAGDFQRRAARTASKRRREYSREKQAGQVYESIHEPESELRTDMHPRERVEDSFIQNKISVFARFFKSHPRGHRGQYLVRDYSIDQKTNSIFNEFVRQELPPSVRQATASRRLSGAGISQISSHRLQRKQTDPALMVEGRRDRLAPSMRSVSLGSESSASSARRISPQDSIEEKDDEMGEETIFVRCLPARPVCVSAPHTQLQALSPHTQLHTLSPHTQLQALSIHEIPVIKFSEQELPDTS